MSLDGTTTATGIYLEQVNHGMHTVVTPYLVQHGGELYSSLSPLRKIAFGKPTANGKFTEVFVDGERVYSEGHPLRFANT